MDFCSNCDNMYYIKLENEECDKIVYYCRNCGTIDDKLLNVNKCILKENIKLQEVWDESDDEFENGEKKVVIRVMEWE